ncbi:MAG TPA: alpha/beta fold hydrolase [bacterium]|nr:alpha/beta fold hydrolase [bacterium]
MEKPVSFRVNGQKIAGVLHLPEGPGRRPAVVFLHGFGGNRMEAHRLFVKTARSLAEKNIASLRFDFRGSGESEGNFKDMSVSGEIQDAVAAVDFIQSQPAIDPKRLALLGLSLGAAVASCVTRRRPGIRSLALWSPLAQISRLFTLPTGFTQKQIRAWISDGQIGYHGESLGVQWLMDLAWHDALRDAALFKGRALIVQGGRDRATPMAQARLFKSRLGSGAQLRVIPGADHTFNSPEWEAEAILSTVKWLGKSL